MAVSEMISWQEAEDQEEGVTADEVGVVSSGSTDGAGAGCVGVASSRRAGFD